MTDVRAEQRPARWLPPTIAAAVILGLVALAVAVFGGSNSPGAAQVSTSPFARRIAATVVGPAWRLTRLRDGFGIMTVLPARNPHDTATLTFKPNGELDGNDGVNVLSARYRLTRAGYLVRGPFMGSAEGYAGPANSPTARVRAAIDACIPNPAADVTLAIHGNTMTLQVGARTLVLVRRYPGPRH